MALTSTEKSLLVRMLIVNVTTARFVEFGRGFGDGKIQRNASELYGRIIKAQHRFARDFAFAIGRNRVPLDTALGPFDLLGERAAVGCAGCDFERARCADLTTVTAAAQVAVNVINQFLY